MTFLFALITESKLVSPAELFLMREALEANAADCAKAWGLDAPAVDVLPAQSTLPEFCQPVVFTDEDSDPEALAYHYWQVNRPAARVLCTKASGVFTGDWSMSELASHEILEALVDPECNQWRLVPTRSGVFQALEVCDPVQDSYDIQPTKDGDPVVTVSNFVIRSYFGSELMPPFDHLGTLVRPFEIGTDGYALFEQNGNTWTENDNGPFAYSSEKPGALHPWSRTMRRLARAA